MPMLHQVVLHAVLSDGMDSSPEIYRTRSPLFARSADTCKSNVDFPIPGSPPINISDPGTIPPPKNSV